VNDHICIFDIAKLQLILSCSLAPSFPIRFVQSQEKSVLLRFFIIATRAWLRHLVEAFGSGSRTIWSIEKLKHLEAFGSGSRTIWSIEKLKTIALFVQLACLTNCMWNWNPTFRLRLHHLNVFDCGSNHPNLLGLRLHS